MSATCPRPRARAGRALVARLERGFSIVTAVFLVVVLALLGAFIVSVTGLQSSSSQLDVLGVRAYQAARAGIEWTAFQTLDPNFSLVGPAAFAACPASPTNLSGLGGSLAPFTVTVTCAVTPATEGNNNIRSYAVTATACNQPAGGTTCPNPAPAAGYVERQVQAVFSKCKDPNAASPRYTCS